MPRLRTAFRFAATAALCVALALGLISHLRGALVGYKTPRLSCYVRSEYGRLIVHAHRTDPCDVQGWLAATWPHAEPALAPGIGGGWRNGGFNYARGRTTIGIPVHQLAIPYWSIAVGALVMRLLCPGPRQRSLNPEPPTHSTNTPSVFQASPSRPTTTRTLPGDPAA